MYLFLNIPVNLCNNCKLIGLFNYQKEVFILKVQHFQRRRKVFKSGPAISSTSSVYNVKGIVAGGLEGGIPLHNIG